MHSRYLALGITDVHSRVVKLQAHLLHQLQDLPLGFQ